MTARPAVDVLAGLTRPARFVLDPEASTVTFRTKHLFGLGRVTGTIAVRSGEIVLAGDSSVSAVLDATSFGTGNDRRDQDVRSARFLDAERFPNLTFRAQGMDGSRALTGRLTVRSETVEVPLTVESLDLVAGVLHGRATARVDRFAFGLTAARGMAARYLAVELAVVGRPA
jgi:polyisoprenoid-binding protein YceI